MATSSSHQGATLVTALYDIGRGQLHHHEHHRPFSRYLDWFKRLLKVNSPLVIFIPPVGTPESGGVDLKEFISEHRLPGAPTTVIIEPFSQLPLYKSRDKIENIMKHLPSKGVNLPNLEFHHPDYIIIIYSKFTFLERTIRQNPHSTNYFFWVDAGYFRKEPNNGVSIAPWPKNSYLERLDKKFLIQNNSFNQQIKWHTSPTTYTLSEDEKRYLKTCPNELLACFFGGHQKIITEVSDKILSVYNAMLAEGIINNEQQGLAVIIRREPNKFHLYSYGKDGRKAIEDFASNGNLNLPYPTCPHIKVIAVASREISDAALYPSQTSTRYFGYNHVIVGREDKWQGWKYRTMKYLQEARKSTEEVIILADSTDLIFSGPSWEAYNKFKSCRKDVIIGVETYIAYHDKKGQHNSYEIEEFFIKQCTSRFCFPNGGFVIGKKDAVIKLLEANQEAADDQAGYMDLAFMGKLKYDLDQDNTFIANLPNYRHFTSREVEFWKWDDEKCRYYNPISHQYPIAIHFAGQNISTQNEMFRRIIPGISLGYGRENFSSLWIGMAFLAFLFLVIVILGLYYFC